MASTAIDIPTGALAALCERRHIAKLAFFGSVLRDDFGPDSDVDALIEFEPGHNPGWEIVDLEEELSNLLGGRRVDLVNPKYLNEHLKDRILADSVTQYEARRGD